MNRPLTRRQIVAAAIASHAAAQTPQQAAPPQADDELAAARDQVRRTAEQLRMFRVPMLLEPGFSFRP